MAVWNTIVGFFKEENPPNETKNETKKPEMKPNLLKTLFAKTDPFSVTTFPYKLTEEFYPPLDDKERKYIAQEVIRWHSIYINTCVESVVELCTSYLIFQKKSFAVKKLLDDNREEYLFLALDTVHQHFTDKARDYILSLSDIELTKWHPVEGKSAYEPPKAELTYLIKELGYYIEEEAKQQIVRLREQEEALATMQSENLVYSEQAELLSAHLKDFLKKNRNTITKHAFDRLILEYNAFPFYYKKTEKEFRNKIFEKYADSMNVGNFNNLMEKVYFELDSFIKIHEKKEARNWMQYEWEEFEKFMTNEYLNLSEQEVAGIGPEDFNVYKLALDFYCIALFKIYLDGMN